MPTNSVVSYTYIHMYSLILSNNSLISSWISTKLVSAIFQCMLYLMGVALVAKHIASYCQKVQGNTLLVIHVTAKGILPAVHYKLDRTL